MYDLVIVGGGPAALAAAIYAAGKQLSIRVVADSLGGKSGWRQRLVGQLEDEYLAGDEAVQVFARRIEQSGVVVVGRVTEVRTEGTTFVVATERGGDLQATAVLVATGAAPIELNVPGAKEFLGQGLGYSVTTHAHIVADKSVAIVGDTLRALRGAAELATTARRLYLLVSDLTILVDPMAQALRGKDNVEILTDTRVREVAGGSGVEELVVEQDGQVRRLAVDAAFIELHLHANSGAVRRLLDLAPGQFIPVDSKNATTIPGLFAAGDVTTAFGEQTLIAIGEGSKAALSVYDFLLARP